MQHSIEHTSSASIMPPTTSTALPKTGALASPQAETPSFLAHCRMHWPQTTVSGDWDIVDQQRESGSSVEWRGKYSAGANLEGGSAYNQDEHEEYAGSALRNKTAPRQCQLKRQTTMSWTMQFSKAAEPIPQGPRACEGNTGLTKQLAGCLGKKHKLSETASLCTGAALSILWLHIILIGVLDCAAGVSAEQMPT
jgi:hypothetical protein